MSTYSSKRLARNTLLMYFRLGVSIIVNFITTRVVFSALGVDNYGLYGVVAGIIVLFSFVNTALSSSAQRFFSYELAKNDYNRLEAIYNALIRIFIIISFLIILLSETIGLWFLNNKMSFPEGKMGLANFVFQISILTTIVQILRVPYDAAILSSERFDFYAYTSLFNAILQLGMVFLLNISPIEPTKSYVILLLLVALFMLIWYVRYCRKNFDFIKLRKNVNRNVFVELLSFSGWSFWGALCNMGYRQGVNIIINVFFGVVLNAAFSIANQVSALVNQFVAGFQSAYNPQITKTCSVGTPEEQTKIVSLASKISFSLLLMVGLCAVLNTDFLLNLWLGDTPENTAALCALMIFAAIVDSVTDPFWIVIFATGRIKTYQIACALLMLGNILFTILAFKSGMAVEISMYIRILMNIGVLITRLIIVKRQTQIKVMYFISHVIFKDFIVVICILPISLFAMYYTEGLMRLLVLTPLNVLILAALLIFILFDGRERTSIKKLIINKIKRQ